MGQRLAIRGINQRLVVPPHLAVPKLPQAEVVATDLEAKARGICGSGHALLVPVRKHPERVRLHTTGGRCRGGRGRRANRVLLVPVGWSSENVHPRTRPLCDGGAHPSQGRRFTFLRGSPYLEVLRWIIGADGVIRGPAGDGRLSPVARDDMADTVTAVLAANGAHDGQTYEVTGPELISLQQVAEEFTLATGRPIAYVKETLEEAWASRRASGAPDGRS